METGGPILISATQIPSGKFRNLLEPLCRQRPQQEHTTAQRRITLVVLPDSTPYENWHKDNLVWRASILVASLYNLAGLAVALRFEPDVVRMRGNLLPRPGLPRETKPRRSRRENAPDGRREARGPNRFQARLLASVSLVSVERNPCGGGEWRSNSFFSWSDGQHVC